MTETLIHLGRCGHSPFRLRQLAGRLPFECSGLYARYEHLVKAERALTDAERRVLDALLDYGPRDDPAPPESRHLATVLPRLGTISPWSSKATEICHTSGLDVVARVERGVCWHVAEGPDLPFDELAPLLAPLYDRMTERLVPPAGGTGVFAQAEPRRLSIIELGGDPLGALRRADVILGLALSPDEIDYLADAYRRLDRSPTDVELMMFAQANSEHCRHKIFNASWQVDGVALPGSLFSQIKHTHRHVNGAGVLSAYTDNAAVIEGDQARRLLMDPADRHYRYRREPVHILMKVETHNHPTAIAPLPGAATGSGGEIRDEGAVGRGSKPKAGLAGFATSHLEIPGYRQPWELDTGRPDRIASALEIMLEGPIGAAAFNNEYGRPGLTGYFRTFEVREGDRVRGYHKPVMIAGGIGNIRAEHVMAADVPVGAALVVLGGPAMLIGLGGGSASSMASGQSSSDLDFASVQRHNPEMQRRCQEVIDACWALGDDNPIRLIHDVGAGGLSNALPELVKDAGRGGRFELRAVSSADPSMSPVEIWCNEAQERYVLAVAPDGLATFEAFCERERCPCALVGEATDDGRLVVSDGHFGNTPVDLPLSVLFGKPPQTLKTVTRVSKARLPLRLPDTSVELALHRVLRFPAVASKRFLITIGDRSITGLVAQEQMVGPWQVPVADVAVTAAGFGASTGEAMAMGERPPVALLSPEASARLAVGEALTNLAAAAVASLTRVVLSANWMAACGENDEDLGLLDAVRAVGEELCPALGIVIPVGKDSLSMRTRWQPVSKRGTAAPMMEVVSPVTLNVTAFAPVTDVRATWTPQIVPEADTVLVLVDLGAGRNRLGGSVLAQVYRAQGGEPPDLDDPERLIELFRGLEQLRADGAVLAYHDRSDGGLVACILEMAIAGRCGVSVDVASDDALAALFSEELGVVLQVRRADIGRVTATFPGLPVTVVARVLQTETVEITHRGTALLQTDRAAVEGIWAETGYQLQRLRDNPDCADQERAYIDDDDPGIRPLVTFDIVPAARFVAGRARPEVAILREQGVNGQLEMAAAFERAGFDPVDVHMTDLLSGRVDLDRFGVLAAVGGFSYGDVLGGGGGWAKSILYHERVRDTFEAYFAADRLVLGVCNGCQMLAQLASLIPGADAWPRFVRNASEQFEGRTVQVRINDTGSPWLAGMAGSVLPVAVAHGEGRPEFDRDGDLDALAGAGNVALQFVDGHHAVTGRYPANPNGAERGIAGITAADGRVLALMPHPERVFLTVQNPVADPTWGEDGPWLRLFQNARTALGN